MGAGLCGSAFVVGDSGVVRCVCEAGHDGPHRLPLRAAECGAYTESSSGTMLLVCRLRPGHSEAHQGDDTPPLRCVCYVYRVSGQAYKRCALLDGHAGKCYFRDEPLQHCDKPVQISFAMMGQVIGSGDTPCELRAGHAGPCAASVAGLSGV